jgi:hypothetical protein
MHKAKDTTQIPSRHEFQTIKPTQNLVSNGMGFKLKNLMTCNNQQGQKSMNRA